MKVYTAYKFVKNGDGFYAVGDNFKLSTKINPTDVELDALVNAVDMAVYHLTSKELQEREIFIGCWNVPDDEEDINDYIAMHDCDEVFYTATKRCKP